YDLFGIFPFPKHVDDLAEFPAQDTAGYVPEDLQSDWVNLRNARVRIHKIHSKRSHIKQRLELLGAVAQRRGRVSDHRGRGIGQSEDVKVTKPELEYYL